MTTEIIIFEIPEKKVLTNKSQKELEYEDLERASKLSSYHFKSFYEIDLLNEKMQPPKSNIVSILCKYIIQYSIPVITTDTTTKFYITLQNEKSIYVYNAVLDKYYIIPSNTQFKIIGVKIPPILSRKYDRHMLVSNDHISNIVLANTGQYGLTNLQSGKFTQQRSGFSHPGTSINTDKNSIIYFTDDDDARKKINDVINYIIYMENYYNVNHLTLHADMKIAPYLPEFLNDGREKWKVLRDNKFDQIINMLKPIINGNIGDSFDYDVYLTIEKNDLFYAYNVGNIAGIDNNIFRREISNKQNNIIIANNYNKQQLENYNKKLELAKKKSIAYDKYKQLDLTKLNDNQLKILELEYQKMEKFLNKNLSLSSKQNQKLWYRLRKSFNDLSSDRIKKALIDIKKEIPTSQLTGNILIEGGVCPHVVTYGEITLKYFNKPWLNTELTKQVVSRYSLPINTSGQYCFICGELLAEADNEGIVRFIGGERINVNITDDPLQVMIWKESMYIINTYIKFNTPIPIKPLVDSIARGLRNIIGEQEAKLFKIRTNTVDSIKDTLNLYTCIYVYAVLCAMMINNPNKLIFGKDKPSGSNDKFSKSSKNKPLIQSESEFVKPLIQSESEFVKELKNPSEIKHVNTLVNEMNKKNNIEKFRNIKVEKFNKQSRIGGGGSNNNERIAARTKRRRNKLKYSYVGGKSTTDVKLYERYILTTALNLIIITKDVIIKRLNYINTDVVKQIFLKNAYTWAKLHSKPIKVVHDSHQHLDEVQYIMNIDPFYNYLYYAKRLSYNAGVEKKCPQNIGDIQSILGRSIDNIKKDLLNDINIYDTIIIPKKWDFKDNLFDSYTYNSFVSTFKYVKQNLYQKTIVPMNLQLVQYYEDNKKLLEEEKKVVYYFSKMNIKPIFELDWLNDTLLEYNDFSPEKLDLAQHYCPSGERHSTGKFIYTIGSGQKDIELKCSDITNWISNNNVEQLAKFANMKLINERCSKCNKLVRTAISNQKSDKSLSEMFKKIDDVLAFYQYYNTRCPKGDLHNIINNKCTKCGLNTNLQYFESDESDAYYNKYITIYKKVEREQQFLAISSLQKAYDEIQESRKLATNKIVKPVLEYKLSLQKIAEWSQVSDVKYNTLVNIGLSEGVKYEDILNNKINPSQSGNTLPNYNIQILKLKNYILQILRSYNTLMNHENIVDIILELKEILLAQKKIDIKNIHKNMPQFNEEFINIDTKYKYILSPDKYANFLLEYLASIIVDISKKSNEKYKVMAKLLVNYFTKNILKQEKSFSKAESIFSKATSNIIDIENDLSDESELSGDGYSGYQTDKSIPEFSDDDKNVSYKNEIGDLSDAFDVENVNDIWDNG
jgi:hypothetical protein